MISLGLLVSFISLSFPNPSFAQEIFNSAVIQPRKNIIEWRYKMINGRWHKRQYDCTNQKWIGSWTPC